MSNEVHAACYGDSLRIGPKRDSNWWGAAPLDADIVAFDHDTLTDRATFLAMNRPSEGVRHLVVGGQPLITDGAGCDGATRPARAPTHCRELRVPVPILLVAGFLVAGKTTVVNHLLAHAREGGLLPWSMILVRSTSMRS